jgi:hypothetical protein
MVLSRLRCPKHDRYRFHPAQTHCDGCGHRLITPFSLYLPVVAGVIGGLGALTLFLIKLWEHIGPNFKFPESPLTALVLFSIVVFITMIVGGTTGMLALLVDTSFRSLLRFLKT